MNDNPVRKRQGLKRGVYIIPTSLTVLNIFFGFVAILFAMRGTEARTLDNLVGAQEMFRYSCWAIAAAAMFDTFDGLVARAMNATSDFGREYDSIADVVAFGVAPAVLVYSWALYLWGRLGGGIAFLFLVAGSMRLARFNINTATTDHRYFVGLPIPGAALGIATLINYAPRPLTQSDRAFAAVIMLLTVGLAFAMVSTIRYRSQKFSNLREKMSFSYLIVLALLLVVMFRWPEEFFFFWFLSYVVSGPLMKLWNTAFPKQTAMVSAPVPESPES